MSSSFLLTLDTQAPEVSWGTVENAIAGEELTVQYMVSEPSLVSAQLRLRDGRLLDMIVEPGLLRVELPADTPEGNATVLALVRDDVDNEATRELSFAVSGVLQEQPSPPFGRRAGIQPTPTVVRVQQVSRASGATRYGVARSRLGVSRAVAKSYFTQRVLKGRQTSTATAQAGAATWSVVSSTARVSSRIEWKLTRRNEPPEAEAELIALDLL